MAEANYSPDKQAVYLLEFEKLRQEIDNRTQISSNLVFAELTALGVGFSFYDKIPDVLIGLTIISCFLWLLWLDQTVQIYKIAAYIGCRLSPNLKKISAVGFEWESFLRIIDKGGAKAALILYGPSRMKDKLVKVHPTEYIGSYITILFGVLPPLFLIIYSVQVQQGLKDGKFFGASIRFFFLFTTLSLWVFACWQFIRFRQIINMVNDALYVEDR